MKHSCSRNDHISCQIANLMVWQGSQINVDDNIVVMTPITDDINLCSSNNITLCTSKPKTYNSDEKRKSNKIVTPSQLNNHTYMQQQF